MSDHPFLSFIILHCSNFVLTLFIIVVYYLPNVMYIILFSLLLLWVWPRNLSVITSQTEPLRSSNVNVTFDFLFLSPCTFPLSSRDTRLPVRTSRLHPHPDHTRRSLVPLLTLTPPFPSVLSQTHVETSVRLPWPKIGYSLPFGNLLKFVLRLYWAWIPNFSRAIDVTLLTTFLPSYLRPSSSNLHGIPRYYHRTRSQNSHFNPSSPV